MSNRYEHGIQEMKKHIGKHAEDYINEIQEVAPLFAKVNVEFAFGDIYGNIEKKLDPKNQELVTLGALTVLGYALPQLKLHISCALNCGASKEEIVEVITQMLPYCGFPAATNAILTAKEVFKENKLI